ncbi:hypothetical protein GW17_00005094 [Ensete ventricosum]|nr:hypothetical protein GW17_00005094 [Ensete ventricosum]
MATLAHRQLPCQGAATPTTDVIAPASDRPSRTPYSWSPLQAGRSWSCPQATACGLALATSSCPLTGGLGRSRPGHEWSSLQGGTCNQHSRRAPSKLPITFGKLLSREGSDRGEGFCSPLATHLLFSSRLSPSRLPVRVDSRPHRDLLVGVERMETLPTAVDKQQLVSSFLEIALGQTPETATQFLQVRFPTPFG